MAETLTAADVRASGISGDDEVAPSQEAVRATLAVENMNCGGCMRGVEKALTALPGVLDARSNLSAKRVSILVEPNTASTDDLIEALAAAGYNAGSIQEAGDDASRARDRDFLRRLAVAGFAAANVMLLSVSVWAGIAGEMGPAAQKFFHWLSAAIALPAIAYAGQPFFTSAIAALKAGRLNMDVPISLGVLLASGMSLFQTMQGSIYVYFDAAITLLFFLLVGRFLDQRMRTRAAGAAANLMGLRQARAILISDDGSRHAIASSAIRPGMRLHVAAGERLPADGDVTGGKSDIDESLITGETLPRSVGLGDGVHAGTVNLTGPLQITATAADEGTLLAEIGSLMEAAEQAKGKYVRLADRAAAIYAPAVHILSLGTFVGWLAFGADWQFALTCAIAVLIITCPCALALAVPAVQVAASSRLFANGVIMKSADALERLAECDAVVFDKTGTLTFGEPRLIDDGNVDEDALARAASLAVNSRHPYSKAIVMAAKARNLDFATEAKGIREVPGSGLVRVCGDGEERLGSAEFVGAAKRGTASLWFKSPGREAVGFLFEDRLRPDAADVASDLKRAGYHVELASGDRIGIVETIAKKLGIDAWAGELKPQNKIARLDALKSRGQKVVMVGDGLNDAPALAAGFASMSPASASEISQTAADVVFQGSDLKPVCETLKVASASRKMALQNFAIALCYNAVFVPLAIAGFVTPLIAAIAMSASSIAVTANALRLRGKALKLEAA